MLLSGFIFGEGRLILPLLPQKYSSFQNVSLLGFILGGGHLILSLCLKSIQVFKMPLSGFIFDSGHLILSLLPQKCSSFQNASLKIYIQRQSFNPIHLFEIYIQRW